MPIILVFLIGAAALGLIGLLIRVLAMLLVGATALVAHPVQTTLRVLQYGFAFIGGLAFLFALMLWFLEPHDKPFRLFTKHLYPYPVGLGIVIGVIIFSAVFSSLFGYLADRPTRAERAIMDRLNQPAEQVVRVVHEYVPAPHNSDIDVRQVVDTTVADTSDR